MLRPKSAASLGFRFFAWAGRDRVAAGAALAAFAVLCIMTLSFAPRLVEPADYAYRASIVAMTQGHFLTLSTAQVDALAAQLPGPGGMGWWAARRRWGCSAPPARRCCLPGVITCRRSPMRR
jgi:hypothetical protein